MVERNVVVAMLISFLFTGLGLAYLADIKRGISLFLIFIIFNLLGLYVARIFSFIALLIWVIGLYMTYNEAQAVNGY